MSEIRAEVLDGVVQLALKVGDGIARIPLAPDVARSLATDLYDSANVVDPAGFERAAAEFAKLFAGAVASEVQGEALKRLPVQGPAH